MRSATHGLKALSVFLLLLLAGGAPISFAADAEPAGAAPGQAGRPAIQAPRPAGDVFAGLDANHDGVLSREEFQTAFPQMREAAFDRIDANQDAVIDRQEWDAFRASHGKGGMAPRMGMGGMPPGRMPPDAGSNAAPEAAQDAARGAASPTPAREPAKPGILPPAAR